MNAIQRERERKVWAKWLERFSLNITEAVFLLTVRNAASCTLVVELRGEQKVKGKPISISQSRHDISVTEGTQGSNTTGNIFLLLSVLKGPCSILYVTG